MHSPSNQAHYYSNSIHQILHLGGFSLAFENIHMLERFVGRRRRDFVFYIKLRTIPYKSYVLDISERGQ